MDYKKSWGLADRIFTENEINILKNKAANFEIETVAYCSFENRFAKSGGLGAVTKAIIPYLNSYKKEIKAVLITPFYPSIIFNKNLSESIISFNISFDNKNIFVEVYENIVSYELPQKGEYSEYFIKIDGFFSPVNNLNDPYLYHENDTLKNDEELIMHSLVFSKAVVHFLHHHNLKKNILLHLQEWQTSLLTLTVKEAMISEFLELVFTSQTMHNPYDAFIEWKKLSLISERINFKTISNIEKYTGEKSKGITVYRLALELADTPVSTVSKNFAKELTEDIIQTKHFTPHLQKIFNINKIIGVNNGLFETFPDVYKNFESMRAEDIEKIKNEKRKTLLEIISGYDKSKTFGALTFDNKEITGFPDDLPIFTMSGRVDFNQKGYDILIEALKKFKKDEIKVIITPLGAGKKEIDYFNNAAKAAAGNLLIITGRMERGFNELRMGSSFGIMPSIYEPFGAAVEYLVFGTVVIARKTGGLVDQIKDKQSGILWREKYIPSVTEIKNFADAKDTPDLRITSLWRKNMSETLYKSLKKAIMFYKNKKLYYNMIIEGFKKAKEFQWEKSVKEYFDIYKYVSRF